MRYQLRYIRILHQGEIVVPLRCMTIMHYRSGTQIPGSRLRLPCEKGTPAVLVFPDRSVPWLSGRASASHAEGRWFDPSRDHHPVPACHRPGAPTSAVERWSEPNRSKRSKAAAGPSPLCGEHEDPATVADRLGIGTAAA